MQMLTLVTNSYYKINMLRGGDGFLEYISIYRVNYTTCLQMNKYMIM